MNVFKSYTGLGLALFLNQIYFNKKFHIKRVRTLLVKTPPSPYPHRTLSYAFCRPPPTPLSACVLCEWPLIEISSFLSTILIKLNQQSFQKESILLQAYLSEFSQF